MTDTKKIINMVVADDHKIFLEGLTSLLKEFKEIHIVGTASNGNEVLQLLENKSVDMVLTDISMPEMDGLKLAKEIHEKYPQIKIMALTMHSEGNIISNMVRNGITGYILKNTGKEELHKAITTVNKGETYFSEAVENALIQHKDSVKQIIASSSDLELSGRELEILKLITSGYTLQEIADNLFISPHTVIFHRRKLLFKLDVKNTAGLIKAAKEQGLLE